MSHQTSSRDEAVIEQLIVLRRRGHNYDECSELLGVGRCSVGRWCRELSLNRMPNQRRRGPDRQQRKRRTGGT